MNSVTSYHISNITSHFPPSSHLVTDWKMQETFSPLMCKCCNVNLLMHISLWTVQNTNSTWHNPSCEANKCLGSYKITAVYGFQRFITMFTTACHLTLSCARWIFIYLTSTEYYSPAMSTFLRWSIPFSFANKDFLFLAFPMCATPHPFIWSSC